MSNAQSPDLIHQHSKDYLWRHLQEVPYFRALLRGVEAHFYQEFNLSPPVVDIGCGDGSFAELTFDRTIDVGIDSSQAAIRQAATRARVYDFLAQCEGGRMPFPDGYFASAISNSVLEHIPHIEDVLAETARVLQPGALFLFCVPNPDYLTELHIPNLLKKIGVYRLGNLYKEWFRRVSRVHHANPPEIWQIRLEQAGFTLERWWHYFSPAALRVLEWGHYFGLPSLVVHALTGRWLIVSSQWNLVFTERVVRPHAEPVPHERGTYTFFVARRVS